MHTTLAYHTNIQSGIHHRAVTVAEYCDRQSDRRVFTVTLSGAHGTIIKDERFECSSYCGDIKEMKRLASEARALGSKWAQFAD